MKQLMPEIKTVAKFKKKRISLDEYKAEELEAILTMKVFEEFHKFNNTEYLADKKKRFTISTFIENASFFMDIIRYKAYYSGRIIGL